MKECGLFKVEKSSNALRIPKDLTTEKDISGKLRKFVKSKCENPVD